MIWRRNQDIRYAVSSMHANPCRKCFLVRSIPYQGKDWIASNGKNGNQTNQNSDMPTWRQTVNDATAGGPISREFLAFVIITELWQPKVARSKNFISNFCIFLKTTRGKIFKILFWKFRRRHWLTLLCSNAKFVGREMVKSRVINQTKKLAPCQTVATAWIVPKICQGQPPTFGSHYSKFHPNRFTSGGVIAERMKHVLLAHRVLAIFVRTLGK